MITIMNLLHMRVTKFERLTTVTTIINSATIIIVLDTGISCVSLDLAARHTREGDYARYCTTVVI